jgi:hypothetical protein
MVRGVIGISNETPSYFFFFWVPPLRQREKQKMILYPILSLMQFLYICVYTKHCTSMGKTTLTHTHNMRAIKFLSLLYLGQLLFACGCSWRANNWPVITENSNKRPAQTIRLLGGWNWIAAVVAFVYLLHFDLKTGDGSENYQPSRTRVGLEEGKESEKHLMARNSHRILRIISFVFDNKLNHKCNQSLFWFIISSIFVYSQLFTWCVSQIISS